MADSEEEKWRNLYQGLDLRRLQKASFLVGLRKEPCIPLGVIVKRRGGMIWARNLYILIFPLNQINTSVKFSEKEQTWEPERDF